MRQSIGPEQDVEAIRSIRQEIENAVNAGDVAAFGRHLTDDVAQLPPDQIVHGREALLEATADAYEAFDMEEHFAIDTIVVVGDLAVEHGTFELTMTPKDGGEALKLHGLPYAYVYERRDGKWRVLRMSWVTE